MKWAIRPFAARDAPGTIAAINAVCAEGRWMRTLRYEPTPAWEHALSCPECANHSLLVVRVQSRIVGWCRIFPVDGQDGKKSAALGIGLLLEYRDRGIGTALIARSLQWARESDLREVTLTTRADNHRAVHVFREQGFRFTGDESCGLIEMGFILREKNYANL